MIQTKRLILKEFEECDLEAGLDLLTNDTVKQTYMLPDFEKRQDAVPLFQRLMSLSKGNDRYVVGIYLNGYLIGYVNEVEKKDGKMELGYLIHPDFHGRGYMTEALAAVTEHLLDNGLNEVVTGAFEENKASLRVMKKAGMTKLEYTDEIEYRGKLHRCIYYSRKRGT